MKRMAAGGAEPAEIEALYRERLRAFLLSATAFLGDGEAALDVVQDAFATALQRRKSFRGEGSLEAWLWTIVLNLARDRRRSARRESAPGELETTESEREQNGDLRAALLALPERQRLAIFLRYYADLSYGEIADALGVSPGTVAASLNAGHAALRRRLQEVER